MNHAWDFWIPSSIQNSLPPLDLSLDGCDGELETGRRQRDGKEAMITMMGRSIDNGEDDSSRWYFNGLSKGGGMDCGKEKCGQ